MNVVGIHAALYQQRNDAGRNNPLRTRRNLGDDAQVEVVKVAGVSRATYLWESRIKSIEPFWTRSSIAQGMGRMRFGLMTLASGCSPKTGSVRKVTPCSWIIQVLCPILGSVDARTTYR